MGVLSMVGAVVGLNEQQTAEAIRTAPPIPPEPPKSFLDRVGDAVNEITAAAESSVAFQVTAAAATGGASLLAQVGYDAATGHDGAVTGAIKDPVRTVQGIPGAVVGGLGLPGMVLDGVSAAGGALGAFGLEPAGVVGEVAEGAQQTLRDKPLTAAAIAAGAAATAFGIPVGAGLLAGGVGDLVGGTAERFIPTETTAAAGDGVQLVDADTFEWPDAF